MVWIIPLEFGVWSKRSKTDDSSYELKISRTVTFPHNFWMKIVRLWHTSRLEMRGLFSKQSRKKCLLALNKYWCIGLSCPVTSLRCPSLISSNQLPNVTKAPIVVILFPPPLVKGDWRNYSRVRSVQTLFCTEDFLLDVSITLVQQVKRFENGIICFLSHSGWISMIHKNLVAMKLVD